MRYTMKSWMSKPSSDAAVEEIEIRFVQLNEAKRHREEDPWKHRWNFIENIVEELELGLLYYKESVTSIPPQDLNKREIALWFAEEKLATDLCHKTFKLKDYDKAFQEILKRVFWKKDLINLNKIDKEYFNLIEETYYRVKAIGFDSQKLPSVFPAKNNKLPKIEQLITYKLPPLPERKTFHTSF